MPINPENSAGPACPLHGLGGLLLLQLHPQPDLVHDPLKALSKGLLGHIWEVLGLPGDLGSVFRVLH